MAQLKTAAISPKIFRHFAVVTIAITFLLAVFADGENRKALAGEVSDQVAQRQEAARIEQAQIAKFGKPKLIQRKPASRQGWGVRGYGDSYDASYGEPSDSTGNSSGGGTFRRGRVNPNAKVPGAYAPYGISQAAWNAMSEEEREAFRRKMSAAQPEVSPEQQRREVEGLLAASAARAGEAGEGED